MLRKTILRDWRDFLEASREFIINLFILRSCVSVPKAVCFVIFQ